jgi:Ca-activated chloride channel family protein
LLLATACSSPRGQEQAASATTAPAAAVVDLSARSTERQATQARQAPPAGQAQDRPAPAASPAAAVAPACCSTGGTAVPNGKPYDSTFFQGQPSNPFVDTLDDHLSTFGMDVDTAAYGIARRYLADGHLPEPDSVRVEEYINALDYQYPTPSGDQDFAIYLEGGPSPYNPRNDLVQVGLQGRRVATDQRKPASLTFVIDTSGSMAIESRLGTVKSALRLLVEQMRPTDSVGIVTFGADARVVLPPTSGSNKQRILSAIDGLKTDGSTSIDAGLREGFKIADQTFEPNQINMVLLCTDGVANNGVSDADGLLRKYQSFLQKGIQLSAFGFGMGNYNDVMLEKLGDKGNGSYAYIDSLDAARRVFVQNLTGTLQTIARDAKIQVDFNPDVVSRYRLLGYEDRDVADQDFRNDRVDGGEVGAGQSVTALYEITRKPGAAGPVATVSMRYQTPDRSRAVEQKSELGVAAIHTDPGQASPRFVQAATVAGFAEVLKRSFWARGISLQDVARAANTRLADSSDPAVRELVSLTQRAATLTPR